MRESHAQSLGPTTPGCRARETGEEMEMKEEKVGDEMEGEKEESALLLRFLQRVSIACYAERCISDDRFCPSV